MKKALIIPIQSLSSLSQRDLHETGQAGITGKNGSYLTELLLAKGYEVHGIIRRCSSFNTGRIDHLFNDPEIHDKKLFLYHDDLTDSSNLNRILEKVKPDKIYNLSVSTAREGNR